MTHLVLLYDVADDFVTRRMPVREEHLKHVRAALDRGDLMMGGTLGDPIVKAMLVFRTTDRSTVEEFAGQDIYVTSGVVLKWEVLPWNVVIGG